MSPPPAGVLRWVAVAGVAVASCGSSAPLVDVDALERELPAALVPDDPGAVSDVRCPSGLVAGGDEVRCVVEIAGVEVAVGVGVEPAPDGGGRSGDPVPLRVEPRARLVDVTATAAALAERLGSELGEPQEVVCDPPTVRVAGPGIGFDCVVTDPRGVAHPVRVEILDTAGTWRVDLFPGEPTAG